MSLTSAFISHQVYLQRLATSEANQVIPYIEEMKAAIKAKVLSFGDDDREAVALEKMLKALDKAFRNITGEWNERLIDDLKEIAKYETGWNVDTLDKNVDANFTLPAPNQVWAAINFQPLQLNDKPVELDALISNWSEVEVSRLVTGVKVGFVQGRTTRQVVKDIIGAGGLADISQRNAMTTVRTAVAHVSNAARQEVYTENADIVEGYEWVSTLDKRTSTICKHYDGLKVYPDSKVKPKPPAHPNCRSSTIPIISSDFDFLDVGAKRAARGADGGTQVSADMTYYDFLKTQPAWFQDDALGPVRGKIFRNAGMTTEEFNKASVDGFGRPLTLKEMAEADKKVADYLYGE